MPLPPSPFALAPCGSRLESGSKPPPKARLLRRRSKPVDARRDERPRSRASRGEERNIDKEREWTNRHGMALLRRTCCFLLLAVWLAATQHCGLTAAGIELLAHADHPSDACTTSCADDACPAVEGVSHPAGPSSPRLPPPEAVLADLGAILLVPISEAEPSGVGLDRAPPEVEAIPRTWRFERRSALPARAPDLVA